MTSFQDVYDHLDQYIDGKMKAANLVGMSVALTDREKLLRVLTYGFSNMADQSSVTPDTLCEIGSIGKSMTSVLLMQQRDAGRLDLHAPVTRYLSWFQVQSKYKPIAVHHLMCHTAGIINSTDIAPHGLYEVMALRETETAFPPGEHFYYSDLGYKALGFLLEQLLDQPYADILQSGLLDPLGMNDTHAVMTYEARELMATGYLHLYDDRPAHSSHPLIPAPWHEYGTGDGSSASTPGDMAAWVRMLLNRGKSSEKRIISEESFHLLAQRVSRKRYGTFYGYGFSIRDINGHACIGHGGQTLGYSSMALADLVDGFGVVVFINGPARAFDAFDIAQLAIRFLQAALHNRKLPPLQKVTDPAKIENTHDYAGTYRMGAKKLTLIADGEQLILQHADDQVVLEKRRTDTFYVHHPDFALALLHFERDEQNQVVEAFHGPDWYTTDRYKGLTCFNIPSAWGAYPGHYRSHNPWRSNFRIILRKDALLLVMPPGNTQILVPMGPDVFRIGEDEHSPERLIFNSVTNGKALRAIYSGCPYYRTFTP